MVLNPSVPLISFSRRRIIRLVEEFWYLWLIERHYTLRMLRWSILCVECKTKQLHVLCKIAASPTTRADCGIVVGHSIPFLTVFTAYSKVLMDSVGTTIWDHV
ncbi:uncharacterized protein PHALS_10760 [Plasmopara halstedii]|uniref:Uncharacterized protein n=1 Tax=Plasmopara halstedii TaxID=4781 RepID=A0A0N7L560_PLAHL|nr:uncharacterized protein PHALS_10760 [Plasmopara halstedii]CEG40571.1 hypothetical protein PHALS_10760 [Plasmopara halstedii]|eukprot:XP_024576940.1 hypothetical protein PHALS_10760 [Plasmopara halstedii]